MTVVALIIAVLASDSPPRPPRRSAAASADLHVWFGLVRFRPEQICAVTDSVSEQQRSVRSISINEQ